MRVLAVYNFDGCRLGQIGTALNEAGGQIDLVRAYRGEPLPPTAADYDGIVVLGGTQNARADDSNPWLPQLADLLRDFSDSDRSVMGVCLGSQLLARAYGAENIIGGASEFGWNNIALTEAGRNDALFADAPEDFPIFQWHDDTFILPEGAVHLARGHTVTNQAFRLGRATYGVQFHFEADRPLVAEWTRDFQDFLTEHQPHWAEQHPLDAAELGPASDAAGLTIARNWVRTMAE